uniref:WSD domain-containing protein n=1 Tax=Caenorhabditis tropicalis TaxID=1561998 RepID=A0A1I7UH37_9PELO
MAAQLSTPLTAQSSPKSERLENTQKSNEQKITSMEELNKNQNTAMMRDAQVSSQLTARLAARRKNRYATGILTKPDFSEARSEYMENSRKLNEDLLADLEKDSEKMQDEEYRKKVDEFRANIAQGGLPDYSMFDMNSPGFYNAYIEFIKRSMRMTSGLLARNRMWKGDDTFREIMDAMSGKLSQNDHRTSSEAFDSLKTDSEPMENLNEKFFAFKNKLVEMRANLAQGQLPDYSMFDINSPGFSKEFTKNSTKMTTDSMVAEILIDAVASLSKKSDESKKDEEMMTQTADIMKKYWENQNYSKTSNEASMEEKDSEIERLRSLLKAKEEEVAEEKAKFRVQEELTNGLRKWVVEKDAELMVRESQIKVKEAELEEKSKKRTLEVEDWLEEVDEKKSKEEEKETIQKLEDLELDSENGDEEEFDLLEDH